MKLPKIGSSLDVEALETSLCCVVHLSTMQPNVMQQVTLRKDKVSKNGLIRLGETPGDEALCWIKPEHIQILEILGIAVESDGKWIVHPVPDIQAAA